MKINYDGPDQSPVISFPDSMYRHEQTTITYDSSINGDIMEVPNFCCIGDDCCDDYTGEFWNNYLLPHPNCCVPVGPYDVITKKKVEIEVIDIDVLLPIIVEVE